jgi:hypothetical protein
MQHVKMPTSPIEPMRTFCLAFLLSALGACAPQLLVSHDDPMAQAVEIKIDGERAGFLEHGERLTVKLRRGWHHVSTVPEGGADNPWAPDGEGWMIYVDRRSEVTLLPETR